MLDRLRGWLRRHGVVRYDEHFFSAQWFTGWETLKEVLAALIASEPRWQRVLDYGCGPGIMIDLMAARGYDYVGCDLSPDARALYLRHWGAHPERYVASLDAVAGREFDLLLAFDVLEHLRDDEVAALLDDTRHVPELLFNVSRVRSIPGHINIKTDAAWTAFFARCGRRVDETGTTRLRERYLALRPGGPDLWHKNLFLLRSAGQ